MNKSLITQNKLSRDVISDITERLWRYCANNKDYKSRLKKWLDYVGQSDRLLIPDIQEYSENLYLKGYGIGYTQNHISTVRSLYRQLLEDRDFFYSKLVPNIGLGLSDSKAYVDEIILRIENKLKFTIKGDVIQDRADSEIGIRLEAHELEAWVNIPMIHRDSNYPKYIRDKAIFALMSITGIRVQEAGKLRVSDVLQTFGGYPALRVKFGKGSKQRMIPYGENDPLPLVYEWLGLSGIDDIEKQGDQPLFCQILRNGETGKNGLSARTIERLFEYYSEHYGIHERVRPHDLRRTYAYLLWKAGVDLVMIKSNLGHSKLETTLGYIGNVVIRRTTPKIIDL